MFSPYLRINCLRSEKLFLMASANLRTALDWLWDIRRQMPSAYSKISASRSSLPLPSELATELILLRISMNFFRFLLCSVHSTMIFPLARSLTSAEEISRSKSMACYMKRLASYSISMSSTTYSFSYSTQFSSNSSRIDLISLINSRMAW